MRQIRFLFTFLFTFFAFAEMAAQDVEISGKVTESGTGLPLPGATIMVEGTSKGTASDIDGNYSITAPKGSILVFSSIGFKSEKIVIENSLTVNVQMQSDDQLVDEIVVTALGIKREKKALGYAVKEVKGEELSNTRENNFVNSLSGRVSGLNVVKSGSGEWGSTNIVLRGYSSLSGGNQPLIVVDGIPISGGSRGTAGSSGGIDYGNGMSDINPDDIETMSVLKGANASALYGSRAANGVIVITTKKGSKEKLTVDYNLTTTFTDILSIPELQNEFGRTLVEQGDATFVEKIDDVYSWGDKMDGREYTKWTGETGYFNPQPDNITDFYQTGQNITNSIAVSTGNQNSSLRLSYANTESEAIIPNSKMTKHSLGVNANSKYNDLVEISAKVNYYQQSTQNRPNLTDSPDNPMYTFLRMPRNIVLSDLEDYKLDSGFPRLFDGRASSWDVSTSRNQNPYWSVYENKNTDDRRRLMGMFSMKINFAEWLNLTLRAGTDYSIDRKEVIVAKRTAYEVNETRSKYSQSFGHGWENNFDYLLNFNKRFSDIGVNVSVGGSTMYQKYEGVSGSGTVLQEDKLFSFNNLQNALPGQWFGQKKINSAYGMASFDYKSLVYLEFTARNDWSSTLPPQNNSYFYSSASLSVILSDMFDAPDWFTYSKLRASIAQVGNDTSPYSYTFNYSIGPGHLEQSYGYKPFTKPLYDLKPEITSAYEVGTENRFFADRLRFDFTYYYTATKNQILGIASPVATGFSSKLINAGKVANNGIEIEISGFALKANDYSLELGANISRNRNHIIELYQDIDKRGITGIGTMSVVATAGGDYGDIMGKRYARDQKGRIILDKNGLPEFDKDETGNDLFILGNIQPDFMGGIFLNANFKGLFLNAFVNYKFGGEFFSNTDRLLAQYGNSPRTLGGREDWAVSEEARIAAGKTEDEWTATGGYSPDGVQLQGDGTYAPTSGLYVSPQKYWNVTFNVDEEFIHDASYIKLNQIRLGYTLPKLWVEKLKLSQISISAVANNLTYLWKAAPYGLDPEASFNGFGIEYSSIPTTRNVGLNLNIKF